jgi:hypothetical protein
VDLDQELDHVTRRLVRRFGDRFEPQEVRDAVAVEAARLRAARVQRFLPVLVERRVLARLTGHPSCVEEPWLLPDGRARSRAAS